MSVTFNELDPADDEEFPDVEPDDPNDPDVDLPEDLVHEELSFDDDDGPQETDEPEPEDDTEDFDALLDQ